MRIEGPTWSPFEATFLAPFLMILFIFLPIALMLSPLAAAIDNGLARTPPMTWSSPSLYAHPSQPHACHRPD